MAFPDRFCPEHGFKMEKIGQRNEYEAEGGNIRAVTQYYRCPKRDLLIFRCPATWAVTKYPKTNSIVSEGRVFSW